MDAGLEFLHLADLSRPHSPASAQVAEVLANDGEVIEAGATPVLDEVRGVVMLTQTCDVVRGCRARPFVEIAPLIEVREPWVEEIRRLKRPSCSENGFCLVGDWCCGALGLMHRLNRL